MDEIKLTLQEQKIVDYLKAQSHFIVAWEELAQFAKDPTTVKLTTVQRTMSEIKRKFILAKKELPFNVKFYSLGISDKQEPKTEVLKPAPAKEEASGLVQIKRTPAGTIMLNNDNRPMAHIDFVLDSSMKRVKTRYGYHQLRDSEWEVFQFLHSNVGKIITISELRDVVVYPKYGSKLPPRWFDAIMRTIHNLRRQVPGLDKRLLTVKSTETSYLFQ